MEKTIHAAEHLVIVLTCEEDVLLAVCNSNSAYVEKVFCDFLEGLVSLVEDVKAVSPAAYIADAVVPERKLLDWNVVIFSLDFGICHALNAVGVDVCVDEVKVIIQFMQIIHREWESKCILRLLCLNVEIFVACVVIILGFRGAAVEKHSFFFENEAFCLAVSCKLSELIIIKI